MCNAQETKLRWHIHATTVVLNDSRPRSVFTKEIGKYDFLKTII
jgi:hypothetical protein